MLRIYHGVLRLALKLLPLGSNFNPKLKRWIEGRKSWANPLLGKTLPGGSIWFHAASSGEFEQAIPLIEWLKEHHPQHSFVISFFSPSGFEQYKQYPGAAAVFYLPPDLPEFNRKLLDLLKPSAALFIKYELWPGLFEVLKERNIPLALVSARFHPGHYLLNPWLNPLLKRITEAVTAVCAQDELSVDTMIKAGFNKVKWCGDTRYDRVAEISLEELPDALAKVEKVDLVAGSTWTKDDVFLSSWLDEATPETRILVFPHELAENRLQACLKIYARHGAVVWKGGNWPDARVVIVGLPKLLSRTYRLGKIAWIGGGFDKGGIHNCLEAAIYGIPVCFGPIYKAYPEAVDLVQAGGGKPITDVAKLQTILNQPLMMEQMGQASNHFMQKNKGATERTLTILKAIGVMKG